MKKTSLTPLDLATLPIVINNTEVEYDSQKQVRFRSVEMIAAVSATNCGTNATGNPDTLHGDD